MNVEAPTGQIIIEGGQLCVLSSYDIIEDNACILMGTSILKASIRAQKREFEEPNRMKDLFPDEPDWKINLRRSTQLFNRFYVNFTTIKDDMDRLRDSLEWKTFDEAVFIYEDRFDTGPALSFYEFEEAKNLMQKV